MVSKTNTTYERQQRDTHSSVSTFIAQDFTGKWNRTNIIKALSATIEISDQNTDSFHFSFEGWYAGHSGSIEGKATILSDSRAIFSVPNESDKTVLTNIYFELKDKDLWVHVSDGDNSALGFGKSVKIDGDYTKSSPIYTNENIVDEIFKDDAMKNRVKRLLGNTAYTEMITVMEDGIAYKNDTLTYSGFLTGAGEGVDIFIDGSKIYCLGYYLDREGFTLYTNDSMYKNELPSFMKCRTDITDYKLNFVYQNV
jgi:hypothetical protein